MTTTTASDLKNEWLLLQKQYDSYEKHSLLLKLVNVGILCTAYFTDRMSLFVVMLLLLVWLQDAIWKTFQSRIEGRLLWLEHCIATASDEAAFQFNRQFQQNRPGNFGLIAEYCRQALRPTVAYPHLLLIILLAFALLA